MGMESWIASTLPGRRDPGPIDSDADGSATSATPVTGPFPPLQWMRPAVRP